VTNFCISRAQIIYQLARKTLPLRP